MKYTVELFADRHRLTAVHLLDAPDGVHALDVVRVDLAESGADHADVWQGDGTGDRTFYTSVHAEPTVCGRCRLMLADPNNAWCADCRADDDPAEFVAGIRVSSGL